MLWMWKEKEQQKLQAYHLLRPILLRYVSTMIKKHFFFFSKIMENALFSDHLINWK